MPLTESTLSAELLIIQGAKPADDAAAAAAFAAGFSAYMLESTSNGSPLNPAVAAAAEAAMVSALAGLSAAGAGAAALQTGVAAYWSALNVPGAYGPSITPVTPPPGVTGLSAALLAAFAANVSGQLDDADSCDALAAAWHPNMLGGSATFPGPVTSPII